MAPQCSTGAKMSSTSDPVMLNVFMSPQYSPSSPDFSPMDTTSTLAPGMLDRHFPMTPFPCLNSPMPSEWIDSDQLSQGIDAYDFASYLELVSPLAMFLHGDSQNCEVPEWEPPPDSGFIAVGGTSGPENAPVTTELSILTNPDGGIDRKVVKDSTQQDPSTVHQNDPRAAAGEHRRAKQEPTSEKGATFHNQLEVLKFSDSRYTCEYPNCDKKSYKRREHLKRHLNQAHSNSPEEWRCDFCETPRTFKRCDNFRKHLSRHLNNSARSRTRHAMSAAGLLGQMEMKMKRRRKPHQYRTVNRSPSKYSIHTEVL